MVRNEMKNVRIHLGTSEHDLALKAKNASKFLSEGNRVKIELFLKGREKYLDREFLKGRLERILHLISEPYKTLQGAKKEGRGLSTILEKDKQK